MNKILIIEDEQSIRRSIELSLQKEGYEVKGAGTIERGGNYNKRIHSRAVFTISNLPDGSRLDYKEYKIKNKCTYNFTNCTR